MLLYIGTILLAVLVFSIGLILYLRGFMLLEDDLERIERKNMTAADKLSKERQEQAGILITKYKMLREKQKANKKNMK